jgi:hypothetical protein
LPAVSTLVGHAHTRHHVEEHEALRGLQTWVDREHIVESQIRR